MSVYNCMTIDYHVSAVL